MWEFPLLSFVTQHIVLHSQTAFFFSFSAVEEGSGTVALKILFSARLLVNCTGKDTLEFIVASLSKMSY